MNKESLLILFGGESNEHEVSLKSASNVIDSIDKDSYDVTTVGITKDGKWYLYEGETENIRNNTWEKYVKYEAVISPSKNSKGIIILKENAYETKESCLSLLGGPRPCKRYQTIKVQWQNEQLQTRIKTFTGWPAQIIQHEIDHCNGILI